MASPPGREKTCRAARTASPPAPPPAPRRDCLRTIGLALIALGWPPIGAAQEAGAVALTLGTAVYDGTPSPFSQVVQAVLVEAGRRADIRIDFKLLPLLRVLEMANEGQVDGDPIRIAGIVDRYPNLVQVPTPVFRSNLMAYALTPEIAQRTRSELRAMRACKVRGVLNAIKHTAGMATTDAVAHAALLDMMRSGRCDIVIAEHMDFETLLKTQPQADVYRWPHAWASEPLYTLLNRRHAALVPRLDAALQSMQRDGAMNRLVAEIHRRHGLALAPEVESSVPR